MSEKEQHASEFKLISCTLSKGDDTKPTALERDMIASLSVHESIVSPFMGATMMISDSKGLLNTFPVEGGENIEIKLKTTWEDEPIRYKFKIFKIVSRIIKNKQQLYILALTSEEVFTNETVRVEKLQTGDPTDIVTSLIRKELKSSKKVFSEKTKFEVRHLPGRSRPFDIIANLTKRSVSNKAVYKNVKKNVRGSKTKTTQEIKGSAGYFFWESRRGYNYYSIDALCDEQGGKFSAPDLNSEPFGPYVEGIANTDVSADQRRLIENFTFKTEVDVLSSLRKGKYSSLMVFFNYSTGQYEEYTYNIKDSYKSMSHLGKQENVSPIPSSQLDLSSKPTRIMSALLDHEAWFNDPQVADPNQNTENPNKYADWVKYYASQSIARYDLLKNQEAELVIPGNPFISAGDKVNVMITNKLADKERLKKPWDKESSGIYLVKEISHLFDFTTGTNGVLKSTLQLFRDSYGMKTNPSDKGDK